MANTWYPYLLQITPAWLQGTNGSNWSAAFANIGEQFTTRARLAIKASMPAFAFTDALARIGTELNLPRGVVYSGGAWVTETDDQYRLRLLSAYPTWATCGTAQGILTALALLGWTNARLYTNTQLAAAAGQTPDGNTTLWGRWWGVLSPPAAVSLTPTVWGGPLPSGYANGFDYVNPSNPSDAYAAYAWGGYNGAGSSPTLVTAINALRNLVTLWQPAHCLCMGFWVLLNASSSMTIVGGHASNWTEESAQFYVTGSSGSTTGAEFFRFAPVVPSP